MKIYDISQPVEQNTPGFKGDTPFTMSWLSFGKVKTSEVKVTPHVATHIDSPMHFGFSERGIGSYNLEYFVGRCLVADETYLSDLKKLERKLEEVGKNGGKVFKVLFRVAKGTGIPTEVLNLLNIRNIHLIGTTSDSIDSSDSKDFSSHHFALSKGMFILENLNLDTVENGAYILHAAPLKWMVAEASPVRAYLIEEKW